MLLLSSVDGIGVSCRCQCCILTIDGSDGVRVELYDRAVGWPARKIEKIVDNGGACFHRFSIKSCRSFHLVCREVNSRVQQWSVLAMAVRFVQTDTSRH